MFAGFAGDPGFSGPLGKGPIIQMGGYCLIGDGEVHKGEATAALFDGLLLNFDELATKYNAKNAAELVCIGYENEGKAFFHELKGSFFFALIDEAADLCFLERSSNELRPLYWQRLNLQKGVCSFAFADSLKTWALLNRRGWRLDRSGISAFLHLGFFPSFFTPIEGLDRLLPGYLLERGAKHLSLTPFKGVAPEASAATEKKLPPCNKTFSLPDLCDQVWQLDMPLANLALPFLTGHPYALALPPELADFSYNIYYNTPSFTNKRIKRRFFRVPIRPMFAAFWLTRRLKNKASSFQKACVLFTNEELGALAPRIYKRFHFPAFVAKILQGHKKGSDFLDYEAINFAHAFDPEAPNSLSYETCLKSDAFFEKYIDDQSARQIHLFLKGGALCDHDIIRRDQLEKVKLSKKQLWALAHLEMWMQLYYEEAPTEAHKKDLKARLLTESGALLL